MKHAPSHLLTEREVADLLRISRGTLSNWRCQGRRELPFVRVGSRVRYRMADVEAYLARATSAQG